MRFLGPVTDAKRDELLARCSAFVLPTLSENFGQVVAEALAAARPVLTTKAAPWRGLVDHGAGWWVETGTDALHAALASCSPGVTVVNIDNGYGAACAALRILGARDLP